jgi:hypothetical protein
VAPSSAFEDPDLVYISGILASTPLGKRYNIKANRQHDIIPLYIPDILQPLWPSGKGEHAPKHTRPSE